MKEVRKKVKKMAKVYIIGKMEINQMDIFQMIEKEIMESIIIIMVKDMKANLNMVKDMEKVFIIGLMVIDMKEILKKIKEMDMEFIFIIMVIQKQDNFQKIKDWKT